MLAANPLRNLFVCVKFVPRVWENLMSFAIVSLARTGSTSVYRVLCTDPALSIAYEPDFSLPNLSTASVRDRCRDLFAKYSGIKHVWDPNGWPFRNREYLTTIETLERSEELIELNATVASFPAKVVFLRRRDLFARVISDLMGQQLGLWGHSPTEPYTPNERVQYRRFAKQSEMAPINSQIVEWYMINAWNQEEALIERTPRDQRLIAYYEDLFDHNSWMQQDFSAWIQLASWVGAQPKLREEYVRNLIAPQDKYNSEEILKKIPNYNELTAKFSGADQRHGRSHARQDGSCAPASEARPWWRWGRRVGRQNQS
jgi:hypothetical protein